MSEFLPNINFTFFTGVVEDDQDPLKLGRVRVRAHGYYTEDTSQITTEDLPWAHVAYMNSKETSVPEKDEWVFGFFLDGREAQKPLVLGVLPGIVDEEPTTSRYARNEDVTTKTTSFSKGSVSEPSDPYAAEYPQNKIIETDAGHRVEIDDTDGAERIHIYHTSGSYIEMQPDGNIVIKSANDSYSLANGDNSIAATGTVDIDGSQIELNGNAKSLVRYEDLEAAMSTFKSTLVTWLDTHVHIGNLGYPTAPPVVPSTTVLTPLWQADLKLAKSPDNKLG